jgi:hypothetical protein
MIDSLSSPIQPESQGTWCSPCINDEPRARTIRCWLLGGTGLSIIFAYVSVSRCSFLSLNYGETATFYDPIVLGLFNIAIADEEGKVYGCVPQNDDARFKDWAFGVSRMFGVLTAIVTTFIFILQGWIMFVMRPDWADQAWRYLQGLFGTALFCQLITFAVFGSSVCTSVDVESFGTMVTVETDCSPGAASAFGGINAILLIILIFSACIIPAPVHPHFIRWVDDDIACESQHDSDGSYQDGDDKPQYPNQNDATDDDDYYDDDGDDNAPIDSRSMGSSSEVEYSSEQRKGRNTDSRVFT